MWLHTFHPAFWKRDWRTENWGVVLDSADRAVGRTAFLGATPFDAQGGLVHLVYELSAGVTIEAVGYDRASLFVSGESPPEE